MPTLADVFRGIDVAAGGMAQGMGMMNELRFKMAMDEKKRAADFEDQKKLLEFKDQLERKQLEFEIDKIRKSYGEYGDNFQPDVSGLDPGDAGRFLTALPQSKSKADKFQSFVVADLLKPNQRAKMKITQEDIKYKGQPIGTRPKVEYTIEEISAQEQAAATTNKSDRLAGEALQTEFEQSTMPMTAELKAQTLPSFIQMAARKREGLQAEAKWKPEKSLERIEAEEAAKRRGAPLKGEAPDKVTMTKGENEIGGVSVGSERHRALLAQGYAEGKTTLTPAQDYLLADGNVVRSYDRGRTYVAADGRAYNLPVNAVQIRTQLTGEDLAAIEAKKRASEEAPSPSVAKIEVPGAEEAALGGTGPYAKFKAGMNAVGGGLGLDAAFGKQGIFPENEQNREYLRILRQKGKKAWMVGGRGAIWEQQRIDTLWPNPDKWWRNPRTEMQKIPILRQTLMDEREFYRRAIMDALPKEVPKLREAQREIESVLDLLGGGVAPSPSTSKDDALIQKYLGQ